MSDTPEAGASDRDRERIVEQLRRHMADGRLDLQEFEDRAGQVYGARTAAELRPLIADLPVLSNPPTVERARPAAAVGSVFPVPSGDVPLMSIPAFKGGTVGCPVFRVGDRTQRALSNSRTLSMYAVIKTGGKQYRVEPGARLEVERLGTDQGSEVSLTPVLVVDGGTVLATPAQLRGAAVTARVVGEAKGEKITGFTYRHKSRNRRRWGHRQKFDVVEITNIQAGGKSVKSDAAPESPAGSEEE